MPQVGIYTVWAVSKITGVDDLLRVSFKCDGRSDTIMDMPVENAPAVDSVVVLEWS